LDVFLSPKPSNLLSHLKFLRGRGSTSSGSGAAATAVPRVAAVPAKAHGRAEPAAHEEEAEAEAEEWDEDPPSPVVTVDTLAHSPPRATAPHRQLPKEELTIGSQLYLDILKTRLVFIMD